MTPNIAQIVDRILAAAEQHERLIVALAGPPAAGKSTLSERLAELLNREVPGSTVVVPMDGYHYDNAVLEPRGQVPIKGAPETFNPEGLLWDLQRIRNNLGDVAVPVFDRPLDLARAGGRIVTPAHRIVIVEGNYLLLDRDPWRTLHDLFDLKLFLEVPDELLAARLLRRWQDMGQDEAGARAKTYDKDMLNSRLVKQASIEPDIRWVAEDERIPT
ncbi:nucleoside triphosphate hydrolase [Marinobacter halodurans]|uniref:Nucleoside triphosphate hydrolase n=1 Tax=Marinobacter halodurans TaxID=2528979 RepID=A0ABY1ZI46_9GAMM|nr:nucleoside triphosphate hydrolase [Marinobacter halodurans]TBW50556.1 nucleoside triphosphate hydrolase [Marinobacter halodurans]